MRTSLLLVLMGLGLGHPATADEPRPSPVRFEADLMPILEKRCLGCHSSALAEGGLSLEGPASLREGGKTGPAVVAGRPDESLVFLLAAHRREPVMPPAAKGKAAEAMTADELTVLRDWIAAGAIDDPAETEGGSAMPSVLAVKALALGPVPESVKAVEAIDLAPDGRRIAVGRGSAVEVVELSSGRVLTRLEGPGDLIQSVRFSKDGARLAAGGFQTARVWDVPVAPEFAWAEPIDLGPMVDRVLAIDFSPDGAVLVAAGGEPSRSGELVAFEMATGRPLWRLPSVHGDTILGARFSPDGSRLATASADKTAKLLDAADGKVVLGLEGHAQHVLGIDWSGDGKRLATAGADGVIKVWDATSGDLKKTSPPVPKAITAVRWLGEKARIVGTSGDRQVRTWNADTGAVERAMGGATGFPNGLSLSRDGNLAVAGTSDGTVFLWDLAAGKERGRLGAGP
jgi:WD40 repeat protein